MRAARELGGAEPSPDGQRIAYASGNGDACTLAIAERDGKTRVVAQLPYISAGCWVGGLTFRWAPDGGELFYGNMKNIIAFSIASGERRLVREGSNRDPVDCNSGASFCVSNQILDISEDGKWLLVTETRQSTDFSTPDRTTVWLVGTGTEPDRRIPPPKGHSGLAPRFGWVGAAG